MSCVFFRGGRWAVWNGDFKSETDTDTHKFRGTHDCSHAIAYCCCTRLCYYCRYIWSVLSSKEPTPPTKCVARGVLCGGSDGLHKHVLAGCSHAHTLPNQNGGVLEGYVYWQYVWLAWSTTGAGLPESAHDKQYVHS